MPQTQPLDLSAGMEPIQAPPAAAVTQPASSGSLDLSAGMEPISQSTPATPAPGTTGVSGVLNKIGEWGAGVVPGAVESAGESIQALPWVGKKIISPEAMQAERAYFAPGSAAEKYGQTTGHIAEPILEFVLGDEALKGVALAEKLGIASKIAKIAQDSPYIGKILQHGVNAARTGTVLTTQALAKGATLPHALEIGTGGGIGGEAISALSEAAPSAADAWKTVTNPFRKAVSTASDVASNAATAAKQYIPSFDALKDVGRVAASEPGAAAVRTVAGVGPDVPILAGSKTAVDEPLADLWTKKSAAYKQIDDTVGFDLKAEKQKLSDTQYAIKQPGADVPKLQAEMDASAQRIADANTNLATAKIDPKIADNLNTALQAGKQFKKGLVTATSADGTVNVDSLLNVSKRLRLDPKFGDRLAQFFGKGDVQAGKPLADAFMSDLQSAQKTGVHAMKAQRIARWVGGLVGGAAIGTAGFEGVSHLLAP